MIDRVDKGTSRGTRKLCRVKDHKKLANDDEWFIIHQLKEEKEWVSRQLWKRFKS